MKNKFIVCILVMSICFFCVPRSAQAYTEYETSKNGKNNFLQEWEVSITFKDNSAYIAKFVYGYDDDWWDEDYVWTRGYNCRTQANVVNGKGCYSGDNVSARMWSIIEIHHKTQNTYVKYRIWFDGKYNNKSIKYNEGVAG